MFTLMEIRVGEYHSKLPQSQLAYVRNSRNSSYRSQTHGIIFKLMECHSETIS
jgi:hypothetical protein